ncbi:SAICAR synthase-like protein [Xylariaceae sp. AK1471]|nr:SAICAR synthase-like protein [Xylariaceae sp. AK1471]
MPPAVTSLELTSLPLIAEGKVRSLYEIDKSKLLIVTTDRISAYDVVLQNGIPNKGKVLTQLSYHWFSMLRQRLPHLKDHFVSLTPPESLTPAERALVHGRSMQARKLSIFPIEVIVRGYITGSAWKEYTESGTVKRLDHGTHTFFYLSGIPQPEGLECCAAFLSPLYTPSTKAPIGQKDQNGTYQCISPAQAREIVGDKYADIIEELAVAIYTVAAEYALSRGIIIADTKFEFALDEASGEIVLADEVLTPDSSRFWDKEAYKVGREQSSLDKQYLRDWLKSNGLVGKENVEIPEEVVAQTQQKYEDVFERLTGRTLTAALASLEK